LFAAARKERKSMRNRQFLFCIAARAQRAISNDRNASSYARQPAVKWGHHRKTFGSARGLHRAGEEDVLLIIILILLILGSGYGGYRVGPGWGYYGGGGLSLILTIVLILLLLKVI
jgi:hypothetical protein